MYCNLYCNFSLLIYVTKKKKRRTTGLNDISLPASSMGLGSAKDEANFLNSLGTEQKHRCQLLISLRGEAQNRKQPTMNALCTYISPTEDNRR